MGLTQRELADRLGTRQQTISEWELGLYQPYSLSLPNGPVLPMTLPGPERTRNPDDKRQKFFTGFTRYRVQNASYYRERA